MSLYVPQPIQILKPSKATEALKGFEPKSLFGAKFKQYAHYLPSDALVELIELIKQTTLVETSLSVKVFRNLGLAQLGLIDWQEVTTEDYGIVSRKVVTTVGVGYLVDAFQNLTELELFKYHAIGTGTNAEAVGNTALQTELTTEYTGNVRATGSQTENGANVYRTVGTNTLDSGTPTIAEHGIMDQAATGGGSLLDRSQFTGIALNGANGDGLQSTYDFTVTSGG